MGQILSNGAAEDQRGSTTGEPPLPSPKVSPITEEQNNSASTEQSPSPPSLEDLIAEATAYADDKDDLDSKAQKALECPCVAGLREGPCGAQFSEAFVCFIKSKAAEKGSDCVGPFIALQDCISANPGAFSADVLGEEGTEEEEREAQKNHPIVAPSWAKEPRPVQS